MTRTWAADSRSSARPSPPCSPPRLHSGTSVSPRPEHHCITKNTCHVSRHSLAHAGTCPHPPGRWAAPGDTYRLPILEPHDLRGRKAVRLTLQRQGLPSQARHVGPASVLPDAGGHWEQAEAQELPPAPGEPQRPGPRLGRPARPPVPAWTGSPRSGPHPGAAHVGGARALVPLCDNQPRKGTELQTPPVLHSTCLSSRSPARVP